MSHSTEYLSQNSFTKNENEAKQKNKNGRATTVSQNELMSTNPLSQTDNETILNDISSALNHLEIHSISFFHRSALEDIERSLQKAFSVNLKQTVSFSHFIKQVQFDLGLERFKKQLSSPEPVFFRTMKTPDNDSQSNHTQTKGLFIAAKVFGPCGRSGVCILSINPEQADPDHKILTPTQNVAQLFFPQLLKSLRDLEKPVPLTPREKEIVKWISRGKSNPDIAQIIGISVHTVNGYLRGIYLKTQTGDRVSLSFYAFHHGLLQ